MASPPCMPAPSSPPARLNEKLLYQRTSTLPSLTPTHRVAGDGCGISSSNGCSPRASSGGGISNGGGRRVSCGGRGRGSVRGGRISCCRACRNDSCVGSGVGGSGGGLSQGRLGAGSAVSAIHGGCMPVARGAADGCGKDRRQQGQHCWQSTQRAVKHAAPTNYRPTATAPRNRHHQTTEPPCVCVFTARLSA